jgi:hypothetical protein
MAYNFGNSRLVNKVIVILRELDGMRFKRIYLTDVAISDNGWYPMSGSLNCGPQRSVRGFGRRSIAKIAPDT